MIPREQESHNFEAPIALNFLPKSLKAEELSEAELKLTLKIHLNLSLDLLGIIFTYVEFL